MKMQSPTIHASAVIIGTQAILIRGASGVGKTSLGHLLIQYAAQYGFAHSCWLADDRVYVEKIQNALIATAPPQIFEKSEVYGLGVACVNALAKAKVALIVDINPNAPIERVAQIEGHFFTMNDIKLPVLRINEVSSLQIQTVFLAYLAILRGQWPIC